MALWLVRAGRYGEYEQKFLEDNRIYLTWAEFRRDLGKFAEKSDLRSALEKMYPDAPKERISNYRGQLWAFGRRLAVGDWIVLPSKYKPAIHVAEIAGEYCFDADAEDPFYHYRAVRWLGTDIPRTNFDQDLLYSFGAFMTICEIQRNDAEKRVRAMAEAGWGAGQLSKVKGADVPHSGSEKFGIDQVDLEEAGLDRITRHINAKFKGHGLARLVGALLKAQGYTVHVSPAGADKGVDILASPGALGFGNPRICVQVKSGSDPVDRPTLDQLIGTMQNFQAEQGLLVSWSGFRSSVDKEKPNQFFRVRLWDRSDLIEQLIEHYDHLDPQLRAELPLKKVWTMADVEDEGE